MLSHISQTTLLILQSLTIIIFFGLLLLAIQKLHAKLLLHSRLIYLTAWIGTPIHELSHSILCLLSGHKIVKVAIFKPNLSDGTLGYVTHAYNPANGLHIIGNLFIGVAPLFGGITASYLLTYFLLPNGKEFAQYLFIPWETDLSFNALLVTLKYLASIVFESYQQDHVKTVLWGYLVASISLHMVPSYADIKGGLLGAVFVILVMAVLRFMAEGLSETILATIYYYSTGMVVGFAVSASLGLAIALLSLSIQFIVWVIKSLLTPKHKAPLNDNAGLAKQENEAN